LITVEYRFGLNGFQTERALDVPQILHALCCPILQSQVLSQPFASKDGWRGSSLVFQPGGHTVVSKLCMITYPSPIDMGFLKGSIRAHCYFDDNGKTVLVEVQGGNVGGNFFRKHGKYLSRGINRGSVMARVFVNC
jgi:hypothetical protein